ncbi:MAG TPA: hypothetical protein DD789_08035 [Firmicutes bacterium]|jgi:hypothetical protein|nr:hypothetical protein [Bacillota bacterium]
MSLPFVNIEYTGNESCVSWQGLSFCSSEKLSSFMQREVAERLKDTPGRDEFESHLKSLALTEMGKENLEAVLKAEIPEERTWAVGEALAEALLISNRGVVFPWNMERDKRNAKGSLPGADIVGFVPLDSGFQLVLGEVKTASETKYPPGVMLGRSGLVHQIDNLARNMSTIYQLLRWLQPRCKNTEYQEAFDHSVALYLNSGNKAASLFGILIRDTAPNKLDLEGRGKALGNTVIRPASCELIAVYLPFEITDLLSQIEGGGAA